MATDIGFEVPKELATSVYQLVEKVKTSGKLRKGSNEVTKSIERNEAKLVVVAEDVSPPEIVMHIPIICAEKNIPVISVPAKEELGASAGMPVSTATIAIVDAGAGKSLLATVTNQLEALKSKPVKKESKAVEKAEVKEIPKAEEEKAEVKESKEEPAKTEEKVETETVKETQEEKPKPAEDKPEETEKPKESEDDKKKPEEKNKKSEEK